MCSTFNLFYSDNLITVRPGGHEETPSKPVIFWLLRGSFPDLKDYLFRFMSVVHKEESQGSHYRKRG